MNWYKEHQAEWKEIIETVAREIGRSEQMVEILKKNQETIAALKQNIIEGTEKEH